MSSGTSQNINTNAFCKYLTFSLTYVFMANSYVDKSIIINICKTLELIIWVFVLGDKIVSLLKSLVNMIILVFLINFTLNLSDGY